MTIPIPHDEDALTQTSRSTLQHRDREWELPGDKRTAFHHWTDSTTVMGTWCQEKLLGNFEAKEDMGRSVEWPSL